MKIKTLLLGCLAALALAASFVAASAPAQAASLQRFWVVNFTDMDIYYVYVNGADKDLMGDTGVLHYNPKKVPDLVQVLKPRNGNCNARVEIIAGYEDEDANYTAYKRLNLCTPGQTLNLYQDDFN